MTATTPSTPIDRPPDQSRLRRALVLGGIGFALATLAGYAVGLGWTTSALVALALVSLFGLRELPLTNSDDAWPPPPDPSTDHGVRREVARLSWSLHGYESRVERPSLLRLRAVTARRLAWRGLSLEDPAQAGACRDVLGATAYDVVLAGPRAHVSFDDFARAVTAVQRLDEDGVG